MAGIVLRLLLKAEIPLGYQGCLVYSYLKQFLRKGSEPYWVNHGNNLVVDSLGWIFVAGLELGRARGFHEGLQRAFNEHLQQLIIDSVDHVIEVEILGDQPEAPTSVLDKLHFLLIP